MTTAGSTLQAVERAKEEGLRVVKVLALVDREEGGRANLQRLGYELESLFCRRDFMED